MSCLWFSCPQNVYRESNNGEKHRINPEGLSEEGSLQKNWLTFLVNSVVEKQTRSKGLGSVSDGKGLKRKNVLLLPFQ